MAAALCPTAGLSQESPNRFLLDGRCVGPDRTGIPKAQARAEGTTVSADEDGRFRLALQPSDHRLEITAPGFTPLHVTVPVTADSAVSFELQPSEQVTVHAEAETLSANPSARVIFRDDAVAANPGRPEFPSPYRVIQPRPPLAASKRRNTLRQVTQTRATKKPCACTGHTGSAARGSRHRRPRPPACVDRNLASEWLLGLALRTMIGAVTAGIGDRFTILLDRAGEWV